jgi:hypothetical protein
MTIINTELHGHGDPLLSVFMKDMPTEKLVEKTTEPKHEVWGHGDPLFHEVLTHSETPRMALHSESQGHGDPLMDVAMEQWDEPAKEKAAKAKQLHTMTHEVFQSQGDPLLKAFRDEIEAKVGEGHAGREEGTLLKDIRLKSEDFAA